MVMAKPPRPPFQLSDSNAFESVASRDEQGSVRQTLGCHACNPLLLDPGSAPRCVVDLALTKMPSIHWLSMELDVAGGDPCR